MINAVRDTLIQDLSAPVSDLSIIEMLLAYCWGSGLPGGGVVKYPPANAADIRHRSLTPGRKDPLEEEMATHSSIPAWRVPWRSLAGYSP